MSDNPKCSVCGVTAKKARLPQGWKRFAGEVFCQSHAKERFRLRAVTFPIASVEVAEWKDFTAALKVSWARATELANWAVRRLLLADGERKATDAKLPPLPRVDLYRLWTDTYHDRQVWTGATQSANAILHSVEANYRDKRFEVIWLNKDRPPRMTYPVPYPVHNAAWKAEYLETDGGKAPVVTVTLDGQKWTMRLRGGFERSRQLKQFAQLASGEAIRGELAIYRQRSFGSHRRTFNEKGAVKTRIMLKLVGHFPAPKVERDAKGIFELRTGKKSLIVGIAPGRTSPWLYHAFALRQTIHDYDAKRQRLSDDLKAERRPISARETDWLDRSGLKMNRRIDSACRLIARMIAQYAVRQKLAGVQWNDDDRRYFERFDWGKLTRYIAEACDNEGLEFTDASGEEMEPDEPSITE